MIKKKMFAFGVMLLLCVSMVFAGGSFGENSNISGHFSSDSVIRSTGAASIPTDGYGAELQFSESLGSGVFITYNRSVGGGLMPSKVYGDPVEIHSSTSPTPFVTIKDNTMAVGLTEGDEKYHFYSSGVWGADGKFKIGPTGNLGMLAYYDQGSGDVYIDQLFDSSSGDIRFRTRTSGTPIYPLTLAGTGYVGINTNGPSYALDVKNPIAGSTNVNINGNGVGADAFLRLQEDAENRWVVYNDVSDTNEFNIYSYGSSNSPMTIDYNTGSAAFITGTYTGTWTDVSDKRLKENFEVLENCLEKVNNIPSYRFNMIGEDTLNLGFQAQDVNKYYSELTPLGADGYYRMDYISYVAVLNCAVQELDKKIESENLNYLQGEGDTENYFNNGVYANIPILDGEYNTVVIGSEDLKDTINHHASITPMNGFCGNHYVVYDNVASRGDLAIVTEYPCKFSFRIDYEPMVFQSVEQFDSTGSNMEYISNSE